MRVRDVAVALFGVLVAGCTSPIAGTAVPAGPSERARCAGGEVRTDAERPLGEMLPPHARYVTNDKPIMDRSVSAEELSPLAEQEPKVLSDAGFRAAWVRIFESGADPFAKVRRETYSLYEFEAADGACAHEDYVDGLERAEPVTVPGVPDVTEISDSPSGGKESTTTLVTTKGRFRLMIKAEAQGTDLARYGGMDMLEQFYNLVV